MVSRASTHAEFYANADCVEVFPIKGISSELVAIKDSTIKIYEGISGAIILSKHDKTLKISNIFNSLFAVWYIHALISLSRIQTIVKTISLRQKIKITSLYIKLDISTGK